MRGSGFGWQGSAVPTSGINRLLPCSHSMTEVDLYVSSKSKERCILCGAEWTLSDGPTIDPLKTGGWGQGGVSPRAALQ